jgi:cell wall-associated NlpC family hydrolase
LTAGALALAVISPALEPVEHPADAAPPVEQAGPDQMAERAVTTERASRANPRRVRPGMSRRVALTPLALSTLAGSKPLPEMSPEAYEATRHEAVRTAVALAVADEREALRVPATEAAVKAREILRGAAMDDTTEPAAVLDRAALISEGDRTARRLAQRRAAELRKAVMQARKAQARKLQAINARARHVTLKPRRAFGLTRAVTRAVTTRHSTARRAHRVVSFGSGMTAVIEFARSQVGKRYVHGGEGPFGFDCSGFTMRAYALAGIDLPHSSGAQAARARSIARDEARPGDLVVGPGHVGIYMGRGMMIDAGNSRVGVVYRKLYAGLRVERL